MNADPIVKEVREAGAKLAAEAGYDVHRFFEILRRAETTYGKPLVREPSAQRDGTNVEPREPGVI
ncbi:MAG: hypothetical protein HY897_17360 [Deltaproteobacteria bacterium]|nr:hypothetical protein [Deltaproteobacteria bacterium]